MHFKSIQLKLNSISLAAATTTHKKVIKVIKVNTNSPLGLPVCLIGADLNK